MNCVGVNSGSVEFCRIPILVFDRVQQYDVLFGAYKRCNWNNLYQHKVLLAANYATELAVVRRALSSSCTSCAYAVPRLCCRRPKLFLCSSFKLCVLCLRPYMLVVAINANFLTDLHLHGMIYILQSTDVP